MEIHTDQSSELLAAHVYCTMSSAYAETVAVVYALLVSFPPSAPMAP